MNMPTFNADAALISTAGIYRSKVRFRSIGVGKFLPMQKYMTSSVSRERDRLSQATPEQCVDILYVPECRQTGPFTECCTNRHEVRCTECTSPTECCTKSEQFSCTECHSTVSGFPIDGVFRS